MLKKSFISIICIMAILVLSIMLPFSVMASQDVPESYMIDFSQYNLKPTSGSDASGNARSNAGDFTLVSDASCEGGKYLNYVKNDDKTSTHITNPAWYMFMLNPTGSYVSTGSIALTPNTKYNITVKYKISGFENEDQIYQFRVYNTLVGNYAPGGRNNDSVKVVFADKGNKTDWTTATGTITTSDATDLRYSLIGCLIPTSSSTATDNYVKPLTGWQAAIDYIKIEEYVVNTSIEDKGPDANADVVVDFDEYKVVADGSVRTNAGTYTIGESEECVDGKYLHFVDSSTTGGTHLAHNMFELNPTGGSESNTVTRLEAGAAYRIKVRYKVSGLDSAYKLHFRLYNSGSNILADWSNGGQYYRILDTGVINTNGWITREYVFTDPGHANTNYSLLATFAPHNSSGYVASAATYEMDIDYFEIEKIGTSAATLGDKAYYTDNEYTALYDVANISTDNAKRIYSVIIGDINNNREISLSDLVRLKKNSVALELSEGDKNLSDIYADDKVDGMDLTMLRKYLLGID